MENIKSNRRSFIKTSTLGTLGIPAILGGCSNFASKEAKLKDVVVTEILEKAPDGKPLKAGLVGCGGRGTGAAVNFLEAGNDLQVTAIGDVFKNTVDTCRALLKSKGQNIPDENCFVGFDAYQKVIDSGVDVVLLCTPPIFRPLHFEYAIQKGKHCFLEKPCAVDPVGARKMLVLGKQAAQQNLSVLNGLVSHYKKNIIETYRRVAGGLIGDVVSAHVSRFRGALWLKQREKGWDDMTYMMRNWVRFNWLYGDLILDTHIHEIDIMSWFMGNKLPVRAEGTGGRQRDITGDTYDFFSVEYEFDNGTRGHCTCRSINGCDNQNIVKIYGTKGYAECHSSKIYNYNKEILWEYPFPKRDDADQSMAVPDGFVQEIMHLVKAIRTNTPVNNVEHLVNATLMAIMGRESAYTGKFITWDQIMASDLNLAPDTYQFGNVPWFKEEIPLAGAPPKV